MGNCQGHGASLHIAVLRGDCSNVESLLKRGVLVNSPTPSQPTPTNEQGLFPPQKDHAVRPRQGDTPLHTAVRRGDLKMVQTLLRHMADVNICNRGTSTPLHVAVGIGRADIIELLIHHGADVNAVLHAVKSHVMPLHLAAMSGHAEVIAILLNRGAIIHAECNRGQNSLHFAARYGHLKSLQILLNFTEETKDTSQHLADKDNEKCLSLVGRKDRGGRTVLQLAVYYFSSEVVEFLLKRSQKFDFLHVSDYDAIHVAIESCSAQMRMRLTLHRTSPNIYNLKTENYFHDVIRVLEILLKSNMFNVNGINLLSETPLYRASNMCKECVKKRAGKEEKLRDVADCIVKVLLEHGANVNDISAKGETALMLAATNGCTHLIRIFFEWQGKSGTKLLLDLRDRHGRTALLRAVINRHVDVVELLIRHGASVNVRDYRGFTSLHAAIHDQRKFWIDYEYYCTIDAVTKRRRQFPSTKTIISGPRRPGIKPYEEYEVEDKETMVKIILNYGNASVNAMNFAGNTPLDLLHQVPLSVTESTLKALEAHGAKPNNPQGQLTGNDESGKCPDFDRDARGRTPLHRLAIAFLSNEDDQFTILREKIDVWKKDKVWKENSETLSPARDVKGRTALHYAVMPSLGQDNLLRKRDDWLRELLITIGCNVNSIDNYGRTPLHYAENSKIYSWLVEQHGASEEVTDKKGYTPKHLQCLSSEMIENKTKEKEARRLVQEPTTDTISNLHVIFSEEQKFTRRLDKVAKEIARLVEKIAIAISERDHRFTCHSILVGSALYKTKTKFPGDFDFDMTLTELSKQCELCPCPVAPSGYVQLKRKGYDSERILYRRNDDFGVFFNEEQLLLTNEVNSRFKILLGEVLCDPHFWENEESFELHEGFEMDITNGIYLGSASLHRQIDLKLLHPLQDGYGDLYFNVKLSLDIVPCIHLKGWLPDETPPSFNDEMKSFGCNLVFDPPHRFYPWVPFTDTYARISFAHVESHVMKSSSRLAKDAYFMAKKIIELIYSDPGYPHQDRPTYSYVLKSCFLYCIEARDFPVSAEDSENFTREELFLLVKIILFCCAEFCDQDFLPCYFMPSFSLPIEGYLKSKHMNTFISEGVEAIFTSTHNSHYTKLFPKDQETNFSNATVQPLREPFNREAFIRKLRNHAKSGEMHNSAAIFLK